MVWHLGNPASLQLIEVNDIGRLLNGWLRAPLRKRLLRFMFSREDRAELFFKMLALNFAFKIFACCRGQLPPCRLQLGYSLRSLSYMSQSIYVLT